MATIMVLENGFSSCAISLLEIASGILLAIFEVALLYEYTSSISL